MVDRLGRPWARATTSSGLNPCSVAHCRHTRATVGVELMRTPSRSNNRAAHCTCVISIDYPNNRQPLFLRFAAVSKINRYDSRDSAPVTKITRHGVENHLPVVARAYD